MKYVLDVSVALCWVMRRALTPKALALRDDYRKSVHELISPSIFSAEAASGLTKSERQRLIAVGQARRLLADILGDAPQQHPYDPLLYRATDISSQTRAVLYDCLYVALAEQQNCELITADDKLINALQGQFSFILLLASLPGIQLSQENLSANSRRGGTGGHSARLGWPYR
jgi:predicted nucleic acid-binding protein